MMPYRYILPVTPLAPTTSTWTWWNTPVFTEATGYGRATEAEIKKARECYSWCKHTLGTKDDRWCYFGIHKKTPLEFRFRYEEDLLAFRLANGLVPGG
jgi:hypothetical protein